MPLKQVTAASKPQPASASTFATTIIRFFFAGYNKPMQKKRLYHAKECQKLNSCNYGNWMMMKYWCIVMIRDYKTVQHFYVKPGLHQLPAKGLPGYSGKSSSGFHRNPQAGSPASRPRKNSGWFQTIPTHKQYTGGYHLQSS